ncbi:hypothetical protein CPB84DRAFT_1820362 [Gymnopilus junonius]|uniref:Uncharacterized protein n=1 Tax=Gymnopilus junonius TaxID=109634 RepID=A0A9P5P0N9_GYMJU|nr:hypothetical protein CPB84DRAFT_1820362 [Gymnopilus junonius]
MSWCSVLMGSFGDQEMETYDSFVKSIRHRRFNESRGSQFFWHVKHVTHHEKGFTNDFPSGWQLCTPKATRDFRVLVLKHKTRPEDAPGGCLEVVDIEQLDWRISVSMQRIDSAAVARETFNDNRFHTTLLPGIVWRREGSWERPMEDMQNAMGGGQGITDEVHAAGRKILPVVPTEVD